jgi:uncharacterized membrane protein
MEAIRARDRGGPDVIDRYLTVLARALEERGVQGRAADRVLTESRDHLLELAQEAGEQEAAERFGDPSALAQQVAAQLATTRTRAATYGSFGALALVGAGYLGVLAAVNLGGGWPDIFAGQIAWLGLLAGIGTFFFPQVALVGGCLALLRAVRLRRGEALPAGELQVMRSRSAVALGAGLLTMGSWAVFAADFRNAAPLASWVAPTILAICGVLAIPLGAACAALLRSAAPQAPAGPAGDVFDDLAPVFRLRPLRPLPDHPWRFALLFAACIGLLGFAMGWTAEGDPGSGVVRGAFEAFAVLICFTALGRRLALRR